MAKRTLFLLRHAKSSWDDPDLADWERPLAPRGRLAAAALGARLARRRFAVDRVLCSTTRRARETLALLDLGRETKLSFEAGLYQASARTLLARLRRLPAGARRVLLIGHDPGIDELARLLAGDGRPKARERLARGFKTGALAELRVPEQSWRELAPGSAFLERFTRPQDLS